LSVVTETGTRALLPDKRGHAAARDGLRLYWEVYGDESTTIVLLPPSPIGHSRFWKAQIHYLARRYRVVAYDGRGNGNSDNPDPSGPWLDRWRTTDCLDVMDATATETAVLAGICINGVWPSVQIAADQPERVLAIVALAPGIPLLAGPNPWWQQAGNRVAAEARKRDYRAFLEFFYGNMFPEPHSTKHVEDAVAYGLDGPVEMLLMAPGEPVAETKEQVEEICRRVRCPVLIVQGDQDNCQNFDTGLALADLIDAEHVRIDGGGHIPGARHPVLVNRLIHGFASRFEQPRPPRHTWVPSGRRPRRALLVSSPIGLGHAWRDVAIARELRRLTPELEIHWLAQAPVTTLLNACGETVHPASRQLASEAAAVDAEAGDHELHAFQMLRRLDEIFCANFMVFHDLVQEQPFDLWIADEAWEVDYFLHENPELKTAPYVWLTDFVGIVPTPDGGEREAFLAADWNAQMVEHVARNPRLRDRSIFIGDPDDIVPHRLGPDLPSIREWTEEHFEFVGYITEFEPTEIADRDALRAALGYGSDEKVCLVAAGGSAVGIHLLRRAVAALPEAKQRVPELRMVVVSGPRIDPATIPARHGVETHGYVHRLYRHLAACDVAICHGGLSTTMELTAAGRPFLYFPLRNHFEQNYHVAHRLDRHDAGRRMNFQSDGPDELASALEAELGRDPEYRPVNSGGAARAAALVAELL
jgi:pimeloyl-ACP methyl ester carboxylesterase/UDP:flavonoid glycosyltransferase YjiC (YdhE family)